MEPIIPKNVREEFLSDAELNLNGPSLSIISEDACSKLTRDEAVAHVLRLSEENRQLHGNVQQANLAMKSACEMISKLKEKDEIKQIEINHRYAQAKEKVESMRREIANRDKTIEELRKNGAQSDSPDATGNIQSATSEQSLKQKADQLSQQLALEKAQKAQMTSQHETANKKIVQLNDELKASQLRVEQLSKSADGRRSDDGHLIENLRSHTMTLQANVKTEKDKNASLQDRLQQLQDKHDQLLSDYHDLLVETEKTGNKEDFGTLRQEYDQRVDSLTAQLVASEDVLATKDTQIQSLQQRLRDHDDLKTRLTQQQQDIEAFREQANVYKIDFEAERKSREELHDERLKLQERIGVLEEELQKQNSAASMAEMRLRHGYSLPRQISTASEDRFGAVGGFQSQTPRLAMETAISQSSAASQMYSTSTMAAPSNQSTTAETTFFNRELKCPMCDHIAPDIDSLQLHCNDCIQ